MKKIYNAPSIMVKDIKIQNILAGSLGVDTSKETNTQYSKQGGFTDISDEDDDL